jgi:hypothetical protein
MSIFVFRLFLGEEEDRQEPHPHGYREINMHPKNRGVLREPSNHNVVTCENPKKMRIRRLQDREGSDLGR